MKTEQEQIEEIVKIILDASKKCFDTDCDCCDDQYEKDCAQYRKAAALVQAGYGDISEHKAEREMLGSQIKVLKQRLNNKYVEIERLKSEFKQLQTNAEILARGVRDLNHENYKLTEKLAKQTRITRDANAKCSGTERYLRPFQYKADRLETKCNDLKKLSDWQREEIKRLKAEVNKGCDDCETVKQAKIDVLNKLRSRISGQEPLIHITDDCITIKDMHTEIDELIADVDGK